MTCASTTSSCTVHCRMPCQPTSCEWCGGGGVVSCCRTAGSHCRSSAVASFCAAVASNPVDVVKTRMMNQRTNNPHLYRTSLDCIIKVGGAVGQVGCTVHSSPLHTQTLRFEGVSALYKGFVPSYLRLGPWNIIVSLHFWVGLEGVGQGRGLL